MKNLGAVFSRNQCLRGQRSNIKEESSECQRVETGCLWCLQKAQHQGRVSTSRDIWSTGLAKPSRLMAGLGPRAAVVGCLD